MNKVEKNLIDTLIEKSEENYPMQNAISDLCKEYLNNNQTDVLSSFIEFYNRVFDISKKQVREIYSKEDISFDMDESIRIVTAKNLFECLSEYNFQDYLNEKENHVVNHEVDNNIIEI